jgi:hypothetical protein
VAAYRAPEGDIAVEAEDDERRRVTLWFDDGAVAIAWLEATWRAVNETDRGESVRRHVEVAS